MTINEIQDEIIEEFSGLDDWMDKYQLLIDLGNEQAPLDEQYKTESNLIDGCQSRVWLQADFANGLIHFSAESDALIVNDLIFSAAQASGRISPLSWAGDGSSQS